MLEIGYVTLGIIAAIAIVLLGLFSRFGRSWNEL
jgi:hypothetical protein